MSLGSLGLGLGTLRLVAYLSSESGLSTVSYIALGPIRHLFVVQSLDRTYCEFQRFHVCRVGRNWFGWSIP